MSRRGWVRALGSVAVIVMAFGLGACGDDKTEGPEAKGPAVSEEGDLSLYCDIVEKLDKEGDQAFAELEDDKNATQEDFKKAEARFVEEHSGDLDELEAASPPEIRDDVTVLLQSLRARAGLGPEPDKEEARDAEKAITAFEKENC
ncbi:MAG: hypothetical protein QOG16_926 [Actinomycetota bacterium]|jgi:hypothetical protein|nr:hypothetical protein [Actinomycetota bacterium]